VLRLPHHPHLQDSHHRHEGSGWCEMWCEIRRHIMHLH
jgi:hypothetical protein